MAKPTGFDTERAVLVGALLNGFKGEDGQAPFPVFAENKAIVGTVKGQSWGRVSVRPGTVDAAEIGTEMLRNPGVLYLQMFLPQDSGTKQAAVAGDILSDVFDFATFPLPAGSGSITCDCVSLSNVGTDAATGLMQVNASVTYMREIFVTPANQ